MLTGCLLLSITPAAQGFIALEHERGWRPDIMVDKVHELHWDVAYSYDYECRPEKRNNDKALTAAVTEALQMWLQPLRDYAKRPIVNDFRYRLSANRHAGDLTIIFRCQQGRSGAAIGRGIPPYINLSAGIKVTPAFMSVLVHEMGHTFGLADTYLPVGDWGNPELDKGGDDATKGTQPSSIMAGEDKHRAVGYSAAMIRTASSGSTRRHTWGWHSETVSSLTASWRMSHSAVAPSIRSSLASSTVLSR